MNVSVKRKVGTCTAKIAKRAPTPRGILVVGLASLVPTATKTPDRRAELPVTSEPVSPAGPEDDAQTCGRRWTATARPMRD